MYGDIKEMRDSTDTGKLTIHTSEKRVPIFDPFR
jgi:hypothetical protein